MGQGRGMPGTTKDHQAERLQAIRLRHSTNTYRGPWHHHAGGYRRRDRPARRRGGEVVRLLTRRQWREGDTAALKAIADRLGLDVPLEGLSLPMREGRGT